MLKLKASISRRQRRKLGAHWFLQFQEPDIVHVCALIVPWMFIPLDNRDKLAVVPKTILAQKLHLEDRIVPIPGNLAQPLLGLPPDTFKVLATEIDAIVHNGADVNLVKAYAALKSANVLGTRKVLRLAVTNGLAKTRLKPVHYISTGVILPSTYSAPKFMEDADLSKVSDKLDNGYAQSKWVSEQMCHEAAQRGLPVSILRPGNMSQSSFTVRWNTSLT
ncbi:hypothetical protein PsorP6_005372 [Peronosclerospora sorghi]|uniref:Uncharacterized protein n=1 Tax=Peronosclerospora sorghi TaxID=230839 RepID=A0ACC0W1A2_9STRA|nr:hypothetical protein PsorP6_005372 [Peronosclerospora sorghi]